MYKISSRSRRKNTRTLLSSDVVLVLCGRSKILHMPLCALPRNSWLVWPTRNPQKLRQLPASFWVINQTENDLFIPKRMHYEIIFAFCGVWSETVLDLRHVMHCWMLSVVAAFGRFQTLALVVVDYCKKLLL